MLLGIGQGARVRRILSGVFLFVTDMCFCLFGASAAILLTYNISGGVFRGCAYLGMGLGLLIYRLTLGRLMNKIELSLTKLIRKVIRGLIKVLLVPSRAIFSLICKLYALTIGRIIGKIKCKVILQRELRKRELEKKKAAEIVPAKMSEETKEEKNNAEKASRYKKEDRISFGYRGADSSREGRAV